MRNRCGQDANRTRISMLKIGWLLGLLMAGLSIAAGCSSSGPEGPLDSRLFGTWESRRGFVGTDTIEFHDNGTMKVTANDGSKQRSYSGQWYVQKDGRQQISVNMQAQGKEAYRLRKFKFLEDGTFEMREGNKILGRFEKKG